MFSVSCEASWCTVSTAAATFLTRAAPCVAFSRASSALWAVAEAFLATSRMVAFISSTAVAVS